MKTVRTLTTIIATLMALTAGQLSSAQPFPIPTMIVTSNSFADGGVIPNQYSMYGGGTQPSFKITGAPDNTVSYAVIFHDIDVALPGTTNDVVHWLAWNIPSAEISEGSLPEGSVEGTNATMQIGYFGPGAPNTPRYHHYVFEFYALSENLELAAGANREQLLEAMQGKVVAKAAYVGRFKRTE